MKTFKQFINETKNVKDAREKINREKEADRIKHDRMMDTARRRDTVIANRKEETEVDEACWDGYKKVGMKKKGKKMVPDCVPEERSAQDPDIKDREGTQPAAYHKGLKKSTKAKRDAHFKKHGKKADDDASAYKDAPGDKEARAKGMKKSKYTSFVDKMMDEEESKGLAAKAKKSGISVGTLRKVYNRGVAAWKTGHRPGTTPQQWGHARVNAFITKKKKGGLNHDKDLA